MGRHPTRFPATQPNGVTRFWQGGQGKASRVPLPPVSGGARSFPLAGHKDALVVSLVGDFNGWKVQKTICEREASGWTCRVNLPSGTHRYAFLIDGRQIADPAHPSTTKSDDGGPASTIRIDP